MTMWVINKPMVTIQNSEQFAFVYLSPTTTCVCDTFDPYSQLLFATNNFEKTSMAKTDEKSISELYAISDE